MVSKQVLYMRKWRKKHPYYANLMRKKYRLKNPEKVKEEHYQWCLRNHEYLLAYTRQYRQTKKGKISYLNAIKKSRAKRKRNLEWIQLFENPFDESEKLIGIILQTFMLSHCLKICINCTMENFIEK